MMKKKKRKRRRNCLHILLFQIIVMAHITALYIHAFSLHITKG
jgi:hypothetical protein